MKYYIRKQASNLARNAREYGVVTGQTVNLAVSIYLEKYKLVPNCCFLPYFFPIFSLFSTFLEKIRKILNIFIFSFILEVQTAKSSILTSWYADQRSCCTHRLSGCGWVVPKISKVFNLLI